MEQKQENIGFGVRFMIFYKPENSIKLKKLNKFGGYVINCSLLSRVTHMENIISLIENQN